LRALMYDAPARPAPLRIEIEASADAAAVEALVLAAFGPGRFAKTAERLRERARIAAGFVAREGGQVIGSVRLWAITVGDGRDWVPIWCRLVWIMRGTPAFCWSAMFPILGGSGSGPRRMCGLAGRSISAGCCGAARARPTGQWSPIEPFPLHGGRWPAEPVGWGCWFRGQAEWNRRQSDKGVFHPPIRLASRATFPRKGGRERKGSHGNHCQSGLKP
jgi:hypothetical protein